MRLTVETSPLKSALGDIASVTARGVDIFECVELVADETALRLTTSRGDIEAHAKIEAAVATAGRICVNLSDFRFAVAASRESVSLEVVEAGLRMEGKGVAATLPARAEEMPRLPKPEDLVEIDGGVRAFLACAPAASRDESRWSYCGVGFNGECAVGTSGVNVRTYPAFGGSNQMIPITAKAIIAKIGGRLFISDTLWMVESEGRKVFGKNLDASCPDISKLVRPDFTAWTCVAEDLRAAVKAVTFNRADWVVLSACEGGISLKGDKFDGAHIDAQASIPAEGLGATLVCSVASLNVTLEEMTGDVEIRASAGMFEFIAGEIRSMCTPIRDARNAIPEAEAA